MSTYTGLPLVGSSFASEQGIVQGFWRLYTDDFYDIAVPVPSPSEQKAILEWLDIELKTLNDATGKSYSEIDLLREYRTRLVADVVTGQLDVRALKLPVMEDDDELEYFELDEVEDSPDTDQEDGDE